jgi:hypothetical protein
VAVSQIPYEIELNITLWYFIVFGPTQSDARNQRSTAHEGEI